MGAQKDCSNVFVSMVCIVLSGQNKWDHCTHLTWKLGHWLKWDHYKHPLLYHCVLCGGDLFPLDHVCGYQYALLKGQCVYGLYSFWWGTTSETTAHTLLEIWVTGWSETTTSTPYHITLCFAGMIFFSLDHVCGYPFAFLKGQCVYGLYSFVWTEQVRPLHASYFKTRSLANARPPQASFIISLCTMLGWCFIIRSYPCVSVGSLLSARVWVVCTVLPGQNKWDHCTHLTWKLGHWLKWDHYKHPFT